MMVVALLEALGPVEEVVALERGEVGVVWVPEQAAGMWVVA